MEASAAGLAPARRRGSRTAGPVARNLVMTVLAVIWLLPLWLVLITPMKTYAEYASGSQWSLPPNPLHLFGNIADAWSEAGIGPGFLASLLYGVVGSAVAILCGSLGAYAITRLPIRAGFFWFLLVFSGTLFPFQMYLIPLFRLYSDSGLYDTRLGLLLFYSAIATPFCLFVMRGFFSTVPHEVEDAARMDGASRWAIFWRIMLPLAKGPIAVLVLFQFTWIWNDLIFGLVLSTSEGVRPMMPSLASLQGSYGRSGPPLVLAGALVGSLPTVLLFLALGRHLVRGLTLTQAGRS
jgi:multiple sugar transport system permease protein